MESFIPNHHFRRSNGSEDFQTVLEVAVKHGEHNPQDYDQCISWGDSPHEENHRVVEIDACAETEWYNGE